MADERESTAPQSRSAWSSDPLHRLAHGMHAMSSIPAAPATRRIRSTAVLGAGTMGAGIAAACLTLTPVLLVDPQPDALRAAFQHIRRRLWEDVGDGLLSAVDARRRLRHLRLAPVWPEGGDADLIIESVPEELELKCALLRSVEPSLPAYCIWASNTSALCIADIAAAARRPERVIGMHFFHPAVRSRLVEIAAPAGTDADVTATAHALAVLLNKCVLHVVDAPGFFTTRVLSAYLGEALLLMGEGTAVGAIDRVAERYGFATGPFALLDRIGIDVAARVAEYLAAKSRRAASDGSPLTDLAAAGVLGMKSGAGFYVYDDPRRGLASPMHGSVNPAVADVLGIRATRALPAAVIRSRLVMNVVNEAARALHQRIATDRLHADVAAMIALGFPLRTGGPLHYAETRGAAAVAEDLRALASTWGPRFLPAPAFTMPSTPAPATVPVRA